MLIKALNYSQCYTSLREVSTKITTTAFRLNKFSTKSLANYVMLLIPTLTKKMDKKQKEFHNN